MVHSLCQILLEMLVLYQNLSTKRASVDFCRFSVAHVAASNIKT